MFSSVLFFHFFFFVVFFCLLCLFVCLFFFGGGVGGRSKENIFLAKIAHLRLSLSPQFKNTTFMNQQHMKDLLVLFLPQRNSRQTVSLRQTLNANSSVC